MLSRRLREVWHAGLESLSIQMPALEVGSDSRGVMGVLLRLERLERRIDPDLVCDKHWSDVKLDWMMLKLSRVRAVWGQFGFRWNIPLCLKRLS